MKKVIIWGMGDNYEGLLNQILFEIYKGNISIEAIACRKKDKYCSMKDGFPVIVKEEINPDDFDYLIITSTKYFKEIKEEAKKLGIEENKIIDGQLFRQPLFDFAKYVSLIENPVTILSDDCWGGMTYNRLGLPFTSPLVNIYWDRDQYSLFIQDPLFYLNTELQMVSDGDIKKGIWPIGKLGDVERTVSLQFTHSISFADAKEQWDRRKTRINPNNLFVKMGFASNVSNDKKQMYFNSFKAVLYPKILFYYGDEKIDSIFRTERFVWKEQTAENVVYYDYNAYCRECSFWDIDLLKLLTGDKDYSRYS